MNIHNGLEYMREKGKEIDCNVTMHINQLNEDIITFYYELPFSFSEDLFNPLTLKTLMLSKDVSFCVNVMDINDKEFEYLVNDLIVTVKAVKWNIKYKKALNSIYGNKNYQDTDSLSKSYGINFFDNSEYCYSKSPYSESFSFEDYIKEAVKNYSGLYDIVFTCVLLNNHSLFAIDLMTKTTFHDGRESITKSRTCYFDLNRLSTIAKEQATYYINFKLMHECRKLVEGEL